jgi:threonine/homoserine/homoserine lactone efflux protein
MLDAEGGQTVEQTLLGTVGLLVAGAMTPGPNNFIVMREAVRAGWRGALPAIAGIVGGSLALLLLAAAGVGTMLAAEPRLARAVAVVGCLYLAWLGVRLLVSSGSLEAGAADAPGLPTGIWGIFAFQFLNPKAWLLVLTVTASAQATLGPVAALPPLAALFIVIPSACLALWSGAGVFLERRLRHEAAKRWLDRSMGLLLVGSAVLLLLDTWR